MQQKEAGNLLEEFSDVLSDVPGTTNLIDHDIKLTTEAPLRQKPYPIPFSHLPIVENEINSMLDMDVIEPSNSPFSSPIVL